MKNEIVKNEIGELVVFTPPMAFVQVKTVHSLIVDGDGQIDSIHSSGGLCMYRLDEDFVKLLRTKKPDLYERAVLGENESI